MTNVKSISKKLLFGAAVFIWATGSYAYTVTGDATLTSETLGLSNNVNDNGINVPAGGGGVLLL